MTHARLSSALQRFIEAGVTRGAIMAVIVVSSVALGMETWPAATERYGGVLRAIDVIAVAIFTGELAIKLFVYRWAFFRDGWNVFDFIIVGLSLATLGSGTGVLRALRILRTLRLLSLVPRMRLVIQGLLGAIPGMGAVFLLIALVFYISAVMTTKLFGASFPEWFGSIGASLYSLFQIMTLEAWSDGIVRPLMEIYPFAWMFFVPFILITSFIVLNLFIAIIVNAMHGIEREQAAAGEEGLSRQIALLREELAAMRTQLASANGLPIGRPITNST